MSKICFACGKRPTVGNLVSHSNIKTKKRRMPNLQKVRVFINKTVSRLYLCTRCLRTGHFLKPPVRTLPASDKT